MKLNTNSHKTVHPATSLEIKLG